LEGLGKARPSKRRTRSRSPRGAGRAWVDSVRRERESRVVVGNLISNEGSRMKEWMGTGTGDWKERGG